MARNRVGKVAVRLFDQERVAIVRLGAAKRESRLITRAFKFAGADVEGPGLADEVEAQIRHRDVFLERRGARQPFAQAVAEDERCVAETGEPGRARIGKRLHCSKITYVRLRPEPRRRSGVGKSWWRSARTSCPSRRDRRR